MGGIVILVDEAKFCIVEAEGVGTRGDIVVCVTAFTAEKGVFIELTAVMIAGEIDTLLYTTFVWPAQVV
jgi:hypothetical protein